MKNKLFKDNDDYSQLKNKIYIKTLVMLFSALIIIFISYELIFRGYFANWMVGIFQNIMHLEYETAYNLYQQTFRNYLEIFLLIAIIVFFLIFFRLYLNWFTKYFTEINYGIDSLIKEDTDNIVLCSELSATEKKINTIKHTLEKQRLDTQLAEQRKNDLVVYLAHDLKTPLTSVIGYLTLLRDENQISEELRDKYLSISLDKAERLEELINEFFEITRFNLSNNTLDYSRVNLTRMLEQLVYEFKPILAEKNLVCSLDAPSNLKIKCDANKMLRVFDNLLRNAVNYSFDNTEISIYVQQKDPYITLTVTNHGNTIPEEKLEKIFQQFYRLDTARSSNSGGAGLGLAIAKEIVALHQGTISAQSANEITSIKVAIPAHHEIA